ncbi:MAG TPA: SpvB/TcaC N-terminal domain-containing protein [Thermoanaerobaculia bacterium]
MSEKRVFAVPLLGVALLLATLFGFAGTAPPRGSGESEPPAAPPETASAPSVAGAADSGLIFEAAPRVRRIGASLGDAPAAPGAFRFDLAVPVETVTRAFLTYELAGVPHWTAAVRSLNGLPPQGGFGSVPTSGMALQVEEVNPRWLRDGSNEVVFLPVSAGEPPPIGVARVEEGSVPAGDPIPYTVRNLRLVVFTRGERPAGARLRITHPLRGESGPDGAYVRGFADPAAMVAGPAELFVDGSHVSGGVRPGDGTFSVFVPRSGAAGEPWDVEVEVVYPDGTRLRRTVHLRGGTGDRDGEKDGGSAGRSEKAEADFRAGEPKALALGAARIDVAAGSLARPVKLTMRRLAAHELPALDSGMTNVTPLQGGIRMGPHGLKFRKPIHLTLPYDPALLPRGMTEEDVSTFFFDEAAGRWVALPRSPEKAGGAAIVSLTDHFTDFINATLALPDEPAGSNLSPNSLQELAKADPAAQITQIEPPEGGPTGDAMLSFPLNLPPGRHGLAPTLSVRYDSSGGNGWLGLGWDLRLPSIEVSTLFGVPRYDPAKESESYLIDGEQLAPLADPGQDRIADRIYVRRTEGSFERIVRRGSGPAGYSWEVTDKDGVRYLYGLSPQARLRDPASGNVFRWYLEQVIDLHGNTVDYSYTTDAGSGGEPWVQVYPAAIAYTRINGGGAFYQVVFTLDDGNQRADRLSSGRPGFKTVTRRRLATVDVLAGGALVRRYLFNYREGDFRKTLLESIAVTGEDGATELYRHGFDYTPMATQADGYAGFGGPQAWGGIGGTGDFTSSSQVGGGVHGFMGLAPPTCYPHGGAQTGGGGSYTTQKSSFVDVNGDGLPDRIADDGSVDLNRFDPTADTTGQTPGSFESTHFDGVNGLGQTAEWNLDSGIGAHSEFLPVPVSLDVSWIWSHSNDDHALIDMDGDGRPDLVSTANGFRVLKNNGHSFVPSTTAWTGFSGVLSPSSASEASEVLASFSLTDPLRQLVLPYDGSVTITGDVRKKLAGGDGVTASIYLGGTRVWGHHFAADETAACAPGPGDSCGGGLSFDVTAGDSLYFLASSVRDTDADALLWSPVVSYGDRDPQAREPWGAPVFVFDASADFNLAGYRGASWYAPAAGTARIAGPFIKQATSDDVTVIASLGIDPVYSRTFAASEEGSFDEIPTFPVQPGNVLFLRVVSDTPIDPARVQWTPTVTLEGGTAPPQPALVAFIVPKTLPLDQPTQSWPAPADGDNAVQVSWEPSTSNRAVLYVQGVNRLIAKQELTASSQLSLTVPASAGEPLFFTLLVDQEDAGTLSINGGAVPYNLRLRDDGTPASVLSGGYHGWFYGEWQGSAFDPQGLEPPEDENSTPSFVSGVPAPEGTAGLSAPLWKGMGHDLYVAAEGVKPSRRGGNAAGILDLATGALSGSGLSVLRQTSTRTEGISAEAGLGIALSLGKSETAVDLLDMNGDGYPDQVSASGVLFSNGHDGFEPLQGFAGLDSAVREAADVSASTSIGLGINSVKKNGKGKALAVLSSLPSVGNTVALSQTKYDLIDVNGDGLPDRVAMEPGSGEVAVQLNLGYRFGAPEAWELPRWDNSASGRCEDVIDFLSSKLGSLSSLDTLDSLNFTRSSAVNIGASFGPFGGSAGTTLARTLVELADVNGDGLPDRVAKEQGQGFFRVQLNLGDHWDQERRWYAPDWTTSLGDGYNPLGIFSCLDAVSFNGNVEGQASVGAPICIPLVPPVPVTGLQIEVSVQTSSGEGGLQLFLEDLDGDGLADHVLKKAGDSNVYVKPNLAERVNLLSAVHRPLGSTVELSYERRGNHPDMPFNQWVLAATTVRDGRGNAYTTRNEYGNDAYYDRAERESYGFPYVKTVLADGSTVERWFDNQNLYSRHLPLKTAVADAAGNLFRVETMSYSEVTLSSQARFPALVQESTFFHEGSATAGKSTSRTWQYDGLGNVVAMTDSGDDGTADDVNETIAYAADLDAWVFKPQLVEAHDGAGNLLRRTTATYDAAGEMVRQERTLSGGRDPQTGATYDGTRNAVWTFAYDDAGNLVSFVDPTGYTKTTTYDAQTRTHPVQVSDSFGYVTTYAYELKYGELAATTDENGNTLRRAYDSFGRLLRVVGPDDSDASPALAFEYHPAAPVSWAVVHHKDVTRTDPIDSAVFIDSLERVLETKEDAELDLGSGTSTRIGMRVSGRIAFDAKGRIASQGQPVFDSGPASQFVDVPAKNPTELSYDALDRVREVRFPHSAVTRIDYGFGTLDGVPRLLTTRTDPNGRTTRFYSDVQGNVVGVEQTNTIAGVGKTLTTRYDFDALSQLLSVTDALGNATRLEWDTLGRNVVLDNPDAGRTEHRYDPAGNLGAKITANLASLGQQIRYFYTFSRLDRIDYPQSPDVVFTYGGPGAPSNRANRVVTVTDESGTEERSYDKFGNVVLTVKTINSLNGSNLRGPYTSRFQFDSFGRLLSVTYLVGEQLTYGFDAGGRVKTATGSLRRNRYDYLRHIGYDEFGSRVRTVYGNGVENRYAFDPLSRFLSQIRSTSRGRDLQNVSYQHDPTGTILSLKNDVAASAVPSLWGGPIVQSFQYDGLYQVTGATGTYQVALGKTSSYNFTLAYDEVGDIVAKNQLHQITIQSNPPATQQKTSYNWAYTYGGPQPHAPSRIGDRTFRYDLNGNQTGWDSDGGTRRTITWDEENRPLSVTDGSQTTRFLYNAEGVRTNKLGSHGETVYINRWFSIRNGGTVSRHVFADDLRVSTKVSTSAEFLYFYHPDHLGSAQFLTNEQGYPHEHLEYFPSGEFWVNEHADTLNTPFLFSGKEIDGETGLSYFGARYYEPRQGQWISVDPILDEMLDTERLKAPDLSEGVFGLPGLVYGYVGNDPLNNIDPDGHAKIANSKKGKAFEGKIQKKLNSLKVRGGVQKFVREAVVKVTVNGAQVTTRLDFVLITGNGTRVILEAKSSDTAPLTANQKKAFPVIKTVGYTRGNTAFGPTKILKIRPKSFASKGWWTKLTNM